MQHPVLGSQAAGTVRVAGCQQGHRWARARARREVALGGALQAPTSFCLGAFRERGLRTDARRSSAWPARHARGSGVACGEPRLRAHIRPTAVWPWEPRRTRPERRKPSDSFRRHPLAVPSILSIRTAHAEKAGSGEAVTRSRHAATEAGLSVIASWPLAVLTPPEHIHSDQHGQDLLRVSVRSTTLWSSSPGGPRPRSVTSLGLKGMEIPSPPNDDIGQVISKDSLQP